MASRSVSRTDRSNASGSSTRGLPKTSQTPTLLARPRARSASASIPITARPVSYSHSRSGSESATNVNHGLNLKSSRPPSRANSTKSNYSSRSLTVNERETIRDRDESCLFCGMGAASGSQVAHIMSRTRQADHEVRFVLIRSLFVLIVFADDYFMRRSNG